MANQRLYGKDINLSKDIYDHLLTTYLTYGNKLTPGNKRTNGYERLMNMVNTKHISFESLKRLKHEFDYNYKGITDDNATLEYVLNGGDIMREYVTNMLKRLTDDDESRQNHFREVGLKANMELKKTMKQDIIPEVPLTDFKQHGLNDVKRLQEQRIIEMMKKII